MGKYKNIIYFIGITVILLLACGITDVIHYYANQLQYTEYEATIINFEETSGRYRNYYCTVEYYDEDGNYSVIDYVYREYEDEEGDQITIYITDEGEVYRKGYIKYMNHMRLSMLYGIYLFCSLVGLISRKVGGNDEKKEKKS